MTTLPSKLKQFINFIRIVIACVQESHLSKTTQTTSLKQHCTVSIQTTCAMTYVYPHCGLPMNVLNTETMQYSIGEV
jgi:hypothetical protein